LNSGEYTRKVRIGVVGAGAFGRHHLRVLKQLPACELTAFVDPNEDRARAAAAEFGCAPLADIRELAGRVDAAVVAAPTSLHSEIGCALIENGIDILVEKPIAADSASGQRLVDAADRHGRILQIGHLERFNPAVAALKQIVTVPLFFEIHRMSLFSPRSLDIDVVLDLMIHDLDIVLDLVGQLPSEVRAAGLSVLSDKVDIANVRLAFPGGCVANLTASRVSTERVRKLRLFQPHQYVSLDYERQQAAAFTVSAQQRIGFENLQVEKQEPLKLELESFLHSVISREPPRVTGRDGLRALTSALEILVKIEEHTKLVAQQLNSLP
jgi:predicted dehydrogenase